MRGEGKESISVTLSGFPFPVKKKYACVFGLSQLVLSAVVEIVSLVFCCGTDQLLHSLIIGIRASGRFFTSYLF